MIPLPDRLLTSTEAARQRAVAAELRRHQRAVNERAAAVLAHTARRTP